MPFGTLDLTTSTASMPLHAPVYNSGQVNYTSSDMLIITYKTDLASIRPLVPSQLELTDSPNAYIVMANYGMSTFGSYTEFIQGVEVKYKGVAYRYNIELILANEGAIFAGREVFGFPKVFGHVEFDTNNAATRSTGFLSGTVERPPGVQLGSFGFRATHKIQDYGPVPKGDLGLTARVLPNGTGHAVREFYPFTMDIEGAEIWGGVGSVGFTGAGGEFDPLHKAPVVEYVSAVFMKGLKGTLSPAKETFPF